jgi:prophage tail gpP-like protein
MSETIGPPAPQTRRMRLSLDGQAFESFVTAEVVRDLSEICGSFSLRVWEPVRSRAWLGGEANLADAARASLGHKAELAIDGEVVLIGWVEEIRLEGRGEDLLCTIAGRDLAGDLVDCAAAPDGPAEYSNLTLTEIVTRIARPYGLTVRAEVDVGARFPRFGLDPAESALDAIEKACRQRAMLCVSDGIGGLVLTRGGQQRGPAAIRLGESPTEFETTLSWRERFSEIIVKGQTEKAAGNRRAAARLVTTATPLGSGDAPPSAAAPVRERDGVVMTGRARDAGVTRHRPRVVLAQTQSGGASAQEQADWAVRVQRGRSTLPGYTVPDWRAGEGRKLWRPNEIVEVDDRYADLAQDMLVVGVTWLWDDQGARTRLRVAGRDAFDVLREGEERQAQRARTPARALDGTARPLGSG